MSLIIEKDFSLKPFNTFAVEARARYFAQAHDDQEVREALAAAQRLGLPLRVLGGGSNLLFTSDVEALVVRLVSRGIRVLSDEGDHVVLEAEAGEPWHPFVLHSLELGLAGLENLSLIPGTVGAAPIQNVGAYGVEISD
ncbi:MAG: UDP-N-acetylenolpyruvoylglucosamine reductase, partial [Pseudomonadales bacterium 32-61-5]